MDLPPKPGGEDSPDFLRIKPEHPDVAPPRSPRRFFAVPSVRWSLASGDELQ